MHMHTIAHVGEDFDAPDAFPSLAATALEACCASDRYPARALASENATRMGVPLEAVLAVRDEAGNASMSVGDWLARMTAAAARFDAAA